MGTWRCWRCNAALVAQPCPGCQGTGRIVRAPEWTGEMVLVFCQRCRGAGQVMACPQASGHPSERQANGQARGDERR
jgi:DnaJ-class molecular chaperone